MLSETQTKLRLNQKCLFTYGYDREIQCINNMYMVLPGLRQITSIKMTLRLRWAPELIPHGPSAAK